METKLRVAVIGVSLEGIGNSHSRSVIANNDTELAVICEVNEEWAKDRSALYGVPYCTDYHELLDRDDIDIAIICSPDHLHAQMVSDFLHAGKHVLCEKPLALTKEDCQLILDADRETTPKLMVGQVCRKTPSFVKAKQIVDEGVIGDLVYIESEYSHNYTNMPIHWRNSYEIPRHPFTGGACHSVDLLRWFAGNPTEVFAYGNHKLLPAEYGPCDDTMCSLMKFPNGVVGRVFVSIGCQSPGTGIRTLLYGTKGTIIMSAGDRHITLYLADFGFEKSDKILGTSQLYKNGIQIPVALGSHNTAAELAEFVDIIQNDKEVAVSAREGADTVAVCVAAIRSTETGLPVNIEYCK